EDLGREYKIERVVRPRDLGHGRIFGPVAGCRVETEALAVAGQSQLDVVLHVITGHMRKSSVEEFVSVTARPAAVVENDTRGGQGTTAGFENSVIEFDHALGGRIFKHQQPRSLLSWPPRCRHSDIGPGLHQG